jgi:hypothetical protein
MEGQGQMTRCASHLNDIMRAITFVISLSMLSTISFGQDCTLMEKQKGEIYDFHPAKVTAKESERRASLMDEFWNRAKKDNASACLVKLLADAKEGEFFLFDGAALLLEVEPTKAAAEVATGAIVRSDISDVDVPGYISLTLRLNALGADTGPLAVKLITAPEVSGFVPMHALKIDRNVAAMFLFGSLGEEQNDRYLLPLIDDKNPEVRKTAIYLTTASMTPTSFAALRKIPREQLPKELAPAVDSVLLKRADEVKGPAKFTREQVLATLSKFPEEPSATGEVWKSAVLTLLAEDITAVRAARSRSFRSLSDESLYRFYDMTNLLISLINRFDLYSENRSQPAAKHE